MVEDFLKLGFAIFFISFGFLFRGPVRNPIWQYFPLKNSFLDKFMVKSRFFLDWGVFTDCDEHFNDVQIIANYEDREVVWYLLRDNDIAGIKIYSKANRIILAFYYWRHDFMSKAILDSASKYGVLKKLRIQSIRGKSLEPDAYNNKIVTHVYLDWRAS